MAQQDAEFLRWGAEPIHIAAYSGDEPKIYELLEAGASLTARDKHGRMPHHYAALGGRSNVINILMQQGLKTLWRDEKDATAMHCAAFAGHVGVMEYLSVDHHLSYQNWDVVGALPIHYAANGGGQQAFDFLLTKNNDINVLDLKGRNVMWYAADGGQVDFMQTLVTRGLSVDFIDYWGCSTGHIAASRGHLAVLHLLERSGFDFSVVDRKGKTLLHDAMAAGQLGVVEFLARKLDVNAKDAAGRTAMHYAAEFGSRTLMGKLNKHGVSYDEPDEKGRRPIHYAARGGKARAVDFLHNEISAPHSTYFAEDNTGIGLMHMAAEGGSRQALVHLAAKGLSYSARGIEGVVPLHSAAFGGDLATFKFLLECEGVAITVCDDLNRSCIVHCARGGSSSVFEFLRLRNLPCDQIDSKGYHPMHHAASRGHWKIMLCIAGNNKSAYSVVYGQGMQPIHYAAQGGHWQALYLCHCNGDVKFTQIDLLGRCAMHYAAAKGEIQLMQQLHRHSVSYHVLDGKGNAPVHYAAMGGQIETLRFLEAQGLNLLLTNHQGETPLQRVQVRLAKIKESPQNARQITQMKQCMDYLTQYQQNQMPVPKRKAHAPVVPTRGILKKNSHRPSPKKKTKVTFAEGTKLPHNKM